MSLIKVAQYAFYNHPNLESAVIDAPVIEQNAFQNATALRFVDLTSQSAVSIGADVFSGCSNLECIIIRSTALSLLSNTSALTGTKIASGTGGIYVTSSLLSDYKSATNWSAYANYIYSIDDYQVSDN